MDLTNALMLLAVLLGPLLGVQTQKWIERRQERRGRKLLIFKTLMATRAARLSAEHVQALNMIDVEFHDKRGKDKNVVQAWNVYRDHLGSLPSNADNSQIAAWADRNGELLTDLLDVMSKALGYDLDKVHQIKRGTYLPVAHGQLEDEFQALRRGLIELLEGKRRLPMDVLSLPNLEADAQMIEEGIRRILGEQQRSLPAAEEKKLA